MQKTTKDKYEKDETRQKMPSNRKDTRTINNFKTIKIKIKTNQT